MPNWSSAVWPALRLGGADEIFVERVERSSSARPVVLAASHCNWSTVSSVGSNWHCSAATLSAARMFQTSAGAQLGRGRAGQRHAEPGSSRRDRAAAEIVAISGRIAPMPGDAGEQAGGEQRARHDTHICHPRPSRTSPASVAILRRFVARAQARFRIARCRRCVDRESKGPPGRPDGPSKTDHPFPTGTDDRRLHRVGRGRSSWCWSSSSCRWPSCRHRSWRRRRRAVMLSFMVSMPSVVFMSVTIVLSVVSVFGRRPRPPARRRRSSNRSDLG